MPHWPVLYRHILPCLMLFLISARICFYLVQRAKVLDIPNSRSSHSNSTPTLGGIAIVTTFYLGLGLAWIFGEIPEAWQSRILGIAGAGLLVAGISLYDDLKDLPSFIRLLTQTGAALLVTALSLGGQTGSVPGVFPPLVWHTAAVLAALIWMTGLTNALNFMDGLNGMTGGNAFIAALFFGLISLSRGSGLTLILSYALAAGILGFLIFNFPRGRLFMGDVGSAFLGFIFAALAIFGSLYASIPLPVIPLLFFHFIFDTGFTLIRRWRRGENVFQAHRSHLYQLLNQTGLSHTAVSGLYIAMAFFQGLGALWLDRNPGLEGLLIFIPFLGAQILYSYLVMSLARKKGLI